MMKRCLLMALLACASTAAGQVQAPPASEAAKNRDPHGPPDVSHYIQSLEDSKRDAYQKPDEVVKALKLRPDDVVADLGCGPGYFTRRLARAVPQGYVLAVDVEPRQLDRLHEHLKSEAVENVVPVLARVDDPCLPPGRVDVLLVVDTYHHFDDRAVYLEKLKRALKPDGRLVIIDFHKQPLPVGPPPEHKMAREQELGEVEAAGFELVEEPTFLEYHYFLVLKKKREAR
ncbi:MAG: class I SAM-dependent methyltransferase [Planctomycetota bacterium]